MQELKLQEVIRDRNDAVRQRGLDMMMTPGILALADTNEIVSRVRAYDRFDFDSDPYGEHDFGSFEHNGEKIFWKIDYYDQELKYWGDPLNASTRRVLTVMLAEEY